MSILQPLNNYSQPILNEDYWSDYVRADTAFDGNAKKWTDTFLDSVLQEDILPASVANTLDFVSMQEVFIVS